VASFADAIHLRLKALCCRTWGISPGVFERECDEGMVACEDVVEAFILASSDALSGGNVLRVVFREREAERKKRRDQVRALVQRLRMEKAPDARRALEARIEELNRWP